MTARSLLPFYFLFVFFQASGCANYLEDAKKMFTGYWRFSLESLGGASSNVNAIHFRKDMTWEIGRREGTNFTPNEGEFGRYQINPLKNLLVIFDNTELSNKMFYYFNTSNQLVFFVIGQTNQKMYLWKAE